MPGAVWFIAGGVHFAGIGPMTAEIYLKSLELLMRQLNDEQRRTFTINPMQRPHFDVLAKNDGHPWSNKIFRIYRDGPYLHDPDVGCDYCVNPDPNKAYCLPTPDFLLTVKLLLEHSPADLFGVSNPPFMSKEAMRAYRSGHGSIHGYRP